MSKKNMQNHQKIVAELKKQLAAKNRELEIEASLERVRAIAMSMRKPSDMVQVCKVISNQLKKLGVKDIRNIQTVIINERNGKYLNYEYFTAYKKGVIEETEYDKHPRVREMVLAMKKSADTFYGGIMEGKELSEFRKYRKQDNQFPDPLLDKAKLGQYNFYSIGLGALGITSYKKLPDSALEIFQRFHKVFKLAYSRFKDIEQAEAQAREAQIEAALERVRSRTMGMQKSEELKEVIQLVYDQFVHLKINVEHTGFILDYKAREDLHIWLADQREIPSEITIPCFDSLPNNSIKEAKEKGKDSFEYLLTFEEKNKFYHNLFKYIPGVPEESLEYYFNCPGLAGSGVLLENVGLYIENFSGTPYADEEKKTLMRFGKVFQQTYTRFLDLQKAEAQAREALIETALERVRSRSMGMHKSDELKDVVRLLYKEFRNLVKDIDSVNIQLNPDSSKDINFWASVGEDIYPELYHLPYSDLPIFEKLYNAFNYPGEGFIDYLLSKEEKDAFFSEIFKIQPVPPQRKKMIQNAEGMVIMGWFHKYSGIDIVRYDLKRFSEEEKEIVKRFAAAFEQTYIRFLDLQKAEAQAREAQIEAALEKVRSRAMAMNSTDDLASTVDTFFSRLNKLNIVPHRCGVGIVDPETRVADIRATTYTNENVSKKIVGKLKLAGHPVLDRIFETWEQQKEYHPVLRGNEILEYYKVMNPQVEFPDFAGDEIQYGHYFNFKEGGVFAWTNKKLSEDEIQIFRRFTSVLSLTYRRYIDLKEAEEQAREAEIQLALERVRARTMAMHKSNELAETAAILFQQMTELGVTPERLNICLINEADKILEVWATDQQGVKISHHFKASLDEPTTGKRVYDAWKEKKKSITIDLSGKELKDWIRYVREVMGMTIKAELVREHRIHSVAFFSQGMILTTTPEPLPDESIKLLERFADVFNLTYRRFLDLQNAEAQARDAQIEAALERVRSLALGMRKSEEVGNVTDSFFDEFNKLTVKIIGCSIIVADEKNDSMEIWRARSGIAIKPFNKSSFTRTLSVMKENLPEWYSEYREALGSKKGYMQVELSGEDRLRFLNNNAEQSGFTPKEREKYLKTMPAEFVASFLFFKLGYLALISEIELPEDNLSIARRFVDVFDFAYTRFLDLKVAEEQAREAVKQASLDRVRGEIASMRTSEDLNRITPIIWRELKALEVPFIRCGVFIIDEDIKVTHVYLTTPEGKSLGVLNLKFDANELTTNTVEYWKKKQVYKEHWNKEEFIAWTKSMMELGQVQNAETYQGSSAPPESLYLHFVPFAQGMLYVGDVSPLTDKKLDLVKTLAEAFSIAYARYEDFKNLEEAKNKIEITLNELKSAQAQLVHSEKMASLGELTAGIAHEIKNPLNFVNNFSEISGELIEEIEEELEKNDKEEVLSILTDLKQNLEKINQHGKRADSIVKGMLLHSRGSSGEKALTDINDLLDQYVNLAYHGMRAQDKEFNITIEKDYDKNLEKINVVPQDISRVFLNIINNACYAANEKKKMTGDDFQPKLKVSTKNLNDKVEIKITDNGNGIPKDIVDKIFQPFFTTKPTGEGTGLGLSMSYDIVTKVHGGELKVETQEGNGTTFIIQIPG